MKNLKEKTDTGAAGYLNKNCWLVKNLNYAPYKRCQYCGLQFRHCLFLHYQVMSSILIVFFLTLFLLVEGQVSILVIILLFSLVIVYGYFFNKSTEKIIKANFAEKKAKEALEELTENLEERVDEQTRDIKNQTEHLKKLLQMRSEFLDIASHQLKTPVSVILGTASMFKEGNMAKLPQDQQDKFIDNIFKKAKKLGSIISDILRASEMDTEEFKLEPETLKPIQMEEVIKRVYEDTKEEAQEKNLSLEVVKPPQPTSPVLINADYLEQAIFNLVDNAIKYTGKGYVKIILSEEQGKIIIKIEDSGIGIPAADQKKMFDKFARAKNARNMYTDGSGLGLFIIKKIMAAHQGGQISFSSQENKGTTFTITLPVYKLNKS